MISLYLKACETYLPYLLSLYDLDPYSASRGIGDREYWGWKSRDYVNATLQGGVLSLAAFLKLGYFKGLESKILEIIGSIIRAVPKVQYFNYGVDEIMPYENSFCVAASLTVDILYAIELMDARITLQAKDEYIQVCRNLIAFLSKNVESHGIISNHLAAGVAAIYKYEAMTGDKTFHSYGEQILKIVFDHQSAEGWYREYEGADPGYQTLCTYYMGIIYKLTGDNRILQSLHKSLEFLSYCIHPDGTVGGEYGSRNTQIYYPAGFEILKPFDEIAAAISGFMESSIKSQNTVTIHVVDMGNFIPFINNYMMAHLESENSVSCSEYLLPFSQGSFEKWFPDSGLLLVNRPAYYGVAGIKKGGILKVFDKKEKSLVLDDCGYFGELANGKRISTQFYSDNIGGQIRNSKFQLCQRFYTALENYPTPLKFIILRIMNISIMRIGWINKHIKLLLVKILITNKTKFDIFLERDCVFYDDKIVITDKIINRTPQRFKWLDYGRKFSTIHMASSKYYTKHYLSSNNMYSKLDINCLNSQDEFMVCNEIII